MKDQKLHPLLNHGNFQPHLQADLSISHQEAWLKVCWLQVSHSQAINRNNSPYLFMFVIGNESFIFYHFKCTDNKLLIYKTNNQLHDHKLIKDVIVAFLVIVDSDGLMNGLSGGNI